ncbi:hypothetical protein [Frankia gtarii]|uniref:hypothetical protein n=1 Tax=Frankia gtarii TaxID=2950102 RepID=UPI0021C07D9A|nr:hypothetical protein [Frankia gtarii]
MTVWMRIERHSGAHVQVRWTDGIRLVVGASEDIRFAHANDLWPTLRDRGTLKVTEYAEKLYGKAPRCIAYIRARGSEENQDRGLLALGQRPFRPTDLASQVITLAGKQNAVDNERAFRRDLETAESLLASKKAAFEQQYQREEQQLRDIAGRQRARDLRAAAAESWGMHLILTTLLAHNVARDWSETVRNLEGEIERKNADIEAKREELGNLPDRGELVRLVAVATRELEAATKQKDAFVEESGANRQRRGNLTEKLAELRAAAALAPGLSVPAAEDRLELAHDVRRAAEQTVGRIEGQHDQAKARLELLRVGRGGPAGAALDALDAKGIRAVSILDLITFDDDNRAHWEARLSPYSNAVLVAKAHIDRAREALVEHPGTPLLVGDTEITTTDRTQPGGTGVLAELLRQLEIRMPSAGTTQVFDTTLNLEISGGFDIPLTDRRAAIRAAERTLSEISAQLEAATEARAEADQAIVDAKTGLAAAKATVEVDGVQLDLDTLRSRSDALVGLIEGAKKTESEARGRERAADDDYKQADRRRDQINAELGELRTGTNGLARLLEEAAEAREKRRIQKSSVASLQSLAGIGDLAAIETQLAEKEILVDNASRAAYYQQALSALRQAVESVFVRMDETGGSRDIPIPSRSTGGEDFHLGLNTKLQELHNWCDSSRATTEPPRAFDVVAMALTSWLDWNGADDDTTRAEIHERREKSRNEIAAAETQTSETRKWIESQRENQIAIITKGFQDTEKTLNDLLAAVNQDPVALRAQYLDINDINQPLRWELHPQWLPPGRKPVDYSNPPNTAEMIILHLLLATASLVAATNPRGRMLILDESGNNLDGPNLGKVSRVLQQVAEKYGLTVVLACQDIYTDRVARYGAGMIQLLRPSPYDPLNAPPDIIHGQEDPAVLEVLMPYMKVGRADATPVPDGQCM